MSSQNILQVLNQSTNGVSRGSGLMNSPSPNRSMVMNHNNNYSPSLNDPIGGQNNNYQIMLQQQQQLTNYNLSMLQNNIQGNNSMTAYNNGNMSLSPNYHVTNHSTSPPTTLSPNSSNTTTSSSNSTTSTNHTNLMFINETTADVLQRGAFPNYDLSAPSTPKKNSSPPNSNVLWTPPPSSNALSNSPNIKSPPSLKNMKQHSASTLHTATSLRMKKHSGLGNFKNNYFELEMKKTPKSQNAPLMDHSGNGNGSSNTAATTSSTTTSSPARRGIEKSSSFSKKNPLLNLDRHSLAAALSQSNLLHPNQQLQEVGNKKFSLSYNELPEDSNITNSLSSLYGQPQALIGQALHQHVLNPNGLFLNGTSSSSMNGQNSMMDHVNHNYSQPSSGMMNQQPQTEPTTRKKLLTSSASTPNLFHSNSSTQQKHQEMSHPANNLSYFAQQQGVFQQMSSTYPVNANTTLSIPQSGHMNGNHTNQVHASHPKDSSDFDDMLDSLLNEEPNFEETAAANSTSYNRVNLNHPTNFGDVCNNSQNCQNVCPSSPLSIFGDKDDNQQDTSLILDMDNFFLSGNDETENDPSRLNGTFHLDENTQKPSSITQQDQHLPLRPLNPQDVMKEWENICSQNSHHPFPLGSNSPTHLNNLEFDLLDQF
ncbi:hypothetical protein C9374_007828 [Naegleria lovaniensis]|uniref:Uncharacterized protein n=1 Tax=Naegleria lovaniensis TaxID=51637 RepID=A0AA88GKY8_NAELO|nr:uncharacterized protein C9374_007828 [Naegleria lovaniensis]KAG2378680.1 hypothetical protein C9374_007828 [Naegleria lovaniensis]